MSWHSIADPGGSAPRQDPGRILMFWPKYYQSFSIHKIWPCQCDYLGSWTSGKNKKIKTFQIWPRYMHFCGGLGACHRMLHECVNFARILQGSWRSWQDPVRKPASWQDPGRNIINARVKSWNPVPHVLAGSCQDFLGFLYVFSNFSTPPTDHLDNLYVFELVSIIRTRVSKMFRKQKKIYNFFPKF